MIRISSAVVYSFLHIVLLLATAAREVAISKLLMLIEQRAAGVQGLQLLELHISVPIALAHRPVLQSCIQ